MNLTKLKKFIKKIDWAGVLIILITIYMFLKGFKIIDPIDEGVWQTGGLVSLVAGVVYYRIKSQISEIKADFHKSMASMGSAIKRDVSKLSERMAKVEVTLGQVNKRVVKLESKLD